MIVTVVPGDPHRAPRFWKAIAGARPQIRRMQAQLRAFQHPPCSRGQRHPPPHALRACASLAAREGMRQRMRNDVSLACKSTQKQTVSHEPMRFHESGQLSMCRVKSLVHPVKLLASFVDAFGKIIVNRNLCIGGPISAVRLDEMRKIRIFHNDVSVKNEFQKR